MIQGSNHPRTARRALGQDTCGLLVFPVLIFSPGSRCRSRNVWIWEDARFRLLLRFCRHAGSGMADMVPAKREGTAYELPMPSNCFVAAHLVLGPAQRMFDLFVARLDPHP